MELKIWDVSSSLDNIEEEASVKIEDDNESIISTPDISPPVKKRVLISSGRQQWDSHWEFLVSCIAMTIGLGNIWRFPVMAYRNGGGAFLVPYLIVLIVIGIPVYFLELCLGQFTSRNTLQVWRCVPIFKGVGYVTIVAGVCILTYYCAILALPVYYFINSFRNPLPWDNCKEEWAGKGNCGADMCWKQTNRTLADLYFKNKVLKEADDIYHGIGTPDQTLTLCLIFSWTLIYFSILKGIKSSGKVAYFTALFPYCVLFIFLGRGVTLPGAVDGIKYFLTPAWEKLLDSNVWYQAAAQCFFSLNTGLGAIIMFSSHNSLNVNLRRDVLIFAFADTATSFLSGLTTFAILGNLAHEVGAPVESLVLGNDLGLAFVTYPDAIVKINWAPQLFAILFFAMLFTLGFGSATSQAGCISGVICDAFPHLREWVVNLVICVLGCVIGLIYVTPGGQFIIRIVDYYGVSLIIYVTSTLEVVAVCWFYGLYNFIVDVEFMLGFKLGYYWKITYGVIIPISLSSILVYNIAMNDISAGFPPSAIICGWMIDAIAVLFLIYGAYHAMKQVSAVSWVDKFKISLKPRYDWGPRSKKRNEEWQIFISQQDRRTFLQRLKDFSGI